MKVHYTNHLVHALKNVPSQIEKAFYKQIELFVRDIRHPSLHAKKYDEAVGLWQARVTKGWRFYFTIEGNTYNVVDIEKHKD